jgi:predicted dehydrogenase
VNCVTNYTKCGVKFNPNQGEAWMAGINRREFLGTAAAAGVAGSIGRADTAGRKHKIGLIGCGWYGMVVVKAAFEATDVEVVTICDVDSAHLEKAAAEFEKLQGKRPVGHKDYREMLEAPGLEAVVIATPPHWHALPFIAACEKGLDIYCEKPVAYDVREGRAMIDASRKAGNIVQIGFQRRQSEAMRQAAQYIRDGKAGRIVQVEAQIHYTAGRHDRTPQEPPTSLDWDFWCGPAPKLPYSPAVGHLHWRLEKATGNGHLVDWGIHLIDAVRVVLGEGMPRKVAAAGGLYELKDHITTPDVLNVHFDFAACPVVWRHRNWGSAEYRPEVSNGIFFYGEKETVFTTDDRWMTIPKGKDAEPQVHRVGGRDRMQARHVGEFFEAVRSRKPAPCSIGDAHQSTTTVQLAMIAYQVGSQIEWDGQTEQIIGNAQANRLLKREYRAPWKHPYSG